MFDALAFAPTAATVADATSAARTARKVRRARELAEELEARAQAAHKAAPLSYGEDLLPFGGRGY